MACFTLSGRITALLQVKTAGNRKKHRETEKVADKTINEWAKKGMFATGLNIRTMADPQTKTMTFPVSEREEEWKREKLFRDEGPFYHLHTLPLQDRNILDEDNERKTIINITALTLQAFPVQMLAYALMTNHFHFILKGEEKDCQAFFESWKYRVVLFFSRHGKKGLSPLLEAGLTRIIDLKQFRDEIAYVVRNSYVVRPDVNPLGDPWCSGYLYYNKILPLIVGHPVSTLGYRERRRLTCSMNTDIPADFTVAEGMIRPESFVNYRLVEALFPNARKFTMWVFKNVEAQIEVAFRLGERPQVTDDDILRVSLQLCHEKYSANGPKSLSLDQKKQLATLLKNRYYASNGQLARYCNLSPASVAELFPLAEHR